MTNPYPYVADRADGSIVVHTSYDSRLEMNAAAARWLANKLLETADRVDRDQPTT